MQLENEYAGTMSSNTMLQRAADRDTRHAAV